MEKEVVDVLSKEAEKRKKTKEAVEREKLAQSRANKPLPDHIESIESTSVIYNLSPKYLPYNDLNASEFIQGLNDEYALKFRKPKYDPNHLMSIGIDPNDLTEERMLKILLNQSPQLAFENGRYVTGTNKFVPIEAVEMNTEFLSVKVVGVTEIAEDIVAQVFNLFWASASAEKNWDSEEVQNNIRLKSFKTCTRVVLGGSTNNLLNPELVKQIQDNLYEGKNFGSKMVQYSKYDDFEPPKGLTGSWNLEDFSIYFHSFNPVTGRGETSSIDIQTTTRDDRGRGIINVTTELPYASHIDMVSMLSKVANDA